MSRAIWSAALALCLTLGGAGTRVVAQTVPPTPGQPTPAPPTVVPVPTATTDTVPVPPAPSTPRGPRPRPAAAQRSGLLPPVTPKRAFLSSLIAPGLGQSRLRRPTAAAVFVGLEVGIVTMLIKSNVDLHTADAFRSDTVISNYPVDSLGAPVANPPTQPGRFTTALVQSRRLHREDWVAALVFNHLISGAEAFVSANLYDLPAQISARPSSQGGTVVALSITW